MSTYSDLAPGPTLYWPAGTSARWRLAIKQCRTCPALDLTDALEVEFIFKRTPTTPDASALFRKRLTTGGIVAADLALGLVDVIIDSDDTSPADGYSDWVWVTRVTLEDGSILQPFGLAGAARLDALAPAGDGILAADSTMGTIAPVALTPAPLPAYATVAYVDAGLSAASSALSAHIADTTAAHAATAIENTPAGNIAATTVQGAINELDAEKQPVDVDLTAYANAADSAARATLAGVGPTQAVSFRSVTLGDNVADGKLRLYDGAPDAFLDISPNDGTLGFTYSANYGGFSVTLPPAPAGQAIIDASGVTADRVYTLPDASGTVALAEQVQPLDADLTAYADAADAAARRALIGAARLRLLALPQFTVLSSPPAITITDNTTTSTIPSPQQVSISTGPWRKVGTPFAVSAGIYAASSGLSGVVRAQGVIAWEIISDAEFFEFLVNNFNSSLMIWVDDNLIQLSEFTTTSNGQGRLIKLDWTTDAYPRRPRHYRVMGVNLLFASPWINANATAWAPTRSRKLVAVFGDSYTQGTGAAGNGRTWAGAACAALDYDFVPEGVGGTGYLTVGSNSIETRFAATIARFTTPPDEIWLALGYNDKTTDGPTLTAIAAAHAAAVAQARLAWPLAIVRTIGPWTPIGTQADLTATKNTLIASCASVDCHYVDIDNMVRNANIAIYTGGDNVHATALGHEYLGRRIAELIAASN